MDAFVVDRHQDGQIGGCWSFGEGTRRFIGSLASVREVEFGVFAGFEYLGFKLAAEALRQSRPR
jgi:hypothetical protein